MIITNTLNSIQSAQVTELEKLCKQQESLQGSLSLSNEFNFCPDFPCFYLLYHPDNSHELIAFLSIFAPSTDIAEISACTAPAWRLRGCFNTLLEAALQTLQSYHIEDILFVCEPASDAAGAVLETLDADYQYSEYFMERTIKSPAPYLLPKELALSTATEQELSSLSVLHALAFQENTETSHEFLHQAFFLPHSCVKKLVSKKENELLGICCITAENDTISLFGVAIHPSQQQKGYATAMLSGVLQELSITYPHHSITLQVNSRNEAAYALYQNLGFRTKTDFSYYYISTENALELFGE